MAISQTESMIRFGAFELDPASGELSKGGRHLRLPQQSLQLLLVLLERPGEICTRDELQRRLWSSDVFVDFDHGLNKSIQKLRDVLGDSATSPRYIETLPRVGYRFIAPVSGAAAAGVTAAAGVPSATGAPSGSEPETGAPAREASLVAAHPPAAAETTRGPAARWRWIGVCVALAALLVAIAGLLKGRKHPVAEPIHSLAVLPLENLSDDRSQEYFADGMTDELTTMLAKNSTLRIVSRTSVMQYKGVHRPLPQIARELGVDGILEGSVERSGDKVHMTIQLIQGESDTHVWAESYDRQGDDIAGLPQEAAQAIAQKLQSTVTQPTIARYVSPAAHDAYLRGRYVWFSGDNDEAGSYFKKATELQPDYALGWAGVSDYYGQGAFSGQLRPEESLPLALSAARKAVALDDSLPEAHLSLGAVLIIYRRDWVGGDRELSRALALNPRYAEAMHFRAKLYCIINRLDEAIAWQKKAQELDPFSRTFGMGYVYIAARRYDAAIEDAQMRLKTMPNDEGLHWDLAEAYRRKGMYKESVEEWEKIFLGKKDTAALATTKRDFERGGYEATLHGLSNYLAQTSVHQYVSPVTRSGPTSQLGMREETLAFLEQGYREGSPLLLWIQTDPAYDFLHKDERYRMLIRKLGLPPTY